MSYARYGPTSDVYVFEDASTARFECSGCATTVTAAEMLIHLDGHVRAGQKVPPSALAQLRLACRLDRQRVRRWRRGEKRSASRGGRP